MKAIISPFLYVLWRVRVEGREHIPADGPVILAANHQSFCDSFFLPLVVKRRVTYVAKAEYFDSWKTAWFFRAAGQIPMNRSGGDASQRALDTATEVLRGGGVLAIYPEGTRAPDTRLHKGKTGVARLSLGCDVPVVPVGLVGTRTIQPPGSMVMRPFHSVTVRFGPPVGPRARRGAGGDGVGGGRGRVHGPDGSPQPGPGRAAGADRHPHAVGRRTVGPGVRRRVRQPEEAARSRRHGHGSTEPEGEFVTGSKPCRHIPALP